MGTLHLAALILTASGVGDATLYDFGADYCGPCRSMEPVVAQLAEAGFPVRKINIQQDPALAQKFNVTKIPCFVMVVDGREVQRIVGPADLGELQRLFQRAGYTPNGNQAARGGKNVADQVPRWDGVSMSVPTTPALAREMRPLPEMKPLGDAPARAAASNPAPSLNTPRAEPASGPKKFPNALFATVRIKIEDAHGSSFGSGTIIDAGGGEALILTCAHIFRESGGKGKILIDTFSPRKLTGLPGQIVHYDLKSDVGLIVLRTQEPLTVAKLAPAGYQARKGDTVFSVGCNHGNDPTVRESNVTALDKFLGPSNLQIAGAPVQGRSGGGLFNADGLVIGVCNAADPKDNEGLFAALPSLHAELDRNNLGFVYQPRDKAKAGSPFAPPEMPKGMPSEIVGRTPGAGAVQPSSGRVLNESVIIIRPSRDLNGPNEVVILDKTTEAFWDRVEQERRTQSARTGDGALRR